MSINSIIAQRQQRFEKLLKASPKVKEIADKVGVVLPVEAVAEPATKAKGVSK